LTGDPYRGPRLFVYYAVLVAAALLALGVIALVGAGRSG
jgi:hypothetical protein